VEVPYCGEARGHGAQGEVLRPALVQLVPAQRRRHPQAFWIDLAVAQTEDMMKPYRAALTAGRDR